MKPIIGKIVKLTKANGGELEWNALDQKTRTAVLMQNRLSREGQEVYKKALEKGIV
jgi:hypothetical protein